MSRKTHWTEQVFFKTDKARAELAERRHGLRAKHRQLLVLFDGERTLGSLEHLLPQQEILPLIDELAQQGFITDSLPASTAEPACAPLAPEPLDPMKLTRAKAYLIEVSQQHLGLMASQLQREIAEAAAPESLRAALAHWNMALRESRSGACIANPCLNRAHEIIGWQA